MSSPFSTPAAFALALALLSTGTTYAQTAPGVDIISDSLTLDGTLRSVLDANPAITTLDELANAANGRLAQSSTERSVPSSVSESEIMSTPGAVCA